MSAYLQQKVIDDITQMAELTQHQRIRLAALMSTYLELKYQVEVLQAQIDCERQEMGDLLDDAGLQKATIDECALSWVRGSVTSTLDRQKLIAQGVTMAQIEMATISKPKKDYFVIRRKGEKP